MGVTYSIGFDIRVGQQNKFLQNTNLFQPKADGIEYLSPVEEHNTNTATVIEDPIETFTDRQTTERQTSFNQNPEDEIQFPDAESDQETSIILEPEENNVVGSLKYNPEDNESDFWGKSKTKLCLITNKTKENDSIIKENIRTINNKESNREVNIESEEDKKETVRSSPKRNKGKKLKEQSSSNEDKTYNISNKSNTEIEKHTTNMKRQNSVHKKKSALKYKVVDNTTVVDAPIKLNKNKVENETKRRKSTTKLLINTNVKKPSVEKIGVYHI